MYVMDRPAPRGTRPARLSPMPHPAAQPRTEHLAAAPIRPSPDPGALPARPPTAPSPASSPPHAHRCLIPRIASSAYVSMPWRTFLRAHPPSPACCSPQPLFKPAPPPANHHALSPQRPTSLFVSFLFQLFCLVLFHFISSQHKHPRQPTETGGRTSGTVRAVIRQLVNYTPIERHYPCGPPHTETQEWITAS